MPLVTFQDIDSVDSLDVRATLIADIMTAIYGDSVEALLDSSVTSTYSGKSLARFATGIFKAAKRQFGFDPRDGDGDGVIFDGTPQERPAGAKTPGRKKKNSPERIGEIHEKIDAALKGDRTPESATQIADMLGELTVKELRDIKIKFNISASGKVKQELVDKIAKRLDSGRRADKSQQPIAHMGVKISEEDQYWLKPLIPKMDDQIPGTSNHKWAEGRNKALTKLIKGKPLTETEKQIAVKDLQDNYNKLHGSRNGGIMGLPRETEGKRMATGNALRQLGVDPTVDLAKYNERFKREATQAEIMGPAVRVNEPEVKPQPRAPMRSYADRIARARAEAAAWRNQTDKSFSMNDVSAMLFSRAMMLKETTIGVPQTQVSAEIKDGDGDGMIHDGTPQERPANPNKPDSNVAVSSKKRSKPPVENPQAVQPKPKKVVQPKPSPAQKKREAKGAEPIGKAKLEQAAKQAQEQVNYSHTVKPKALSDSQLHDDAKLQIKTAAATMTPDKISKMAKHYEDLASKIQVNLNINKTEDVDPSKLDASGKALLKKAKEFNQKAEIWAHFAENPNAVNEKFDYSPPENVPFDDLVKLKRSDADVAYGGGPESWDDIDSYTQEMVRDAWKENRIREDDFLEWAGESVRDGVDAEEVISNNIDSLLENVDWDNLDVAQGEVVDNIESTVKKAVGEGLKIGKDMAETDSEKLKAILKEASPDWKNGELSDTQVDQIITATEQSLMASATDEVNLPTEAEIAEIIQIDEDDAASQFYEAWRRGKSWASDVDSLIDSEIESRLDDDDYLNELAESEWDNMDSDSAFEIAQAYGYAGDSGDYDSSDMESYGIDDPASFVGAPEGTTVTVKGDSIEVEGPGGFQMNRTISRKSIHADLFKIGDKYKGEATEILSQMVKQAREAGFHEIETYAAGSLGGYYNGYYTWPCMGYDYDIDGLSQAGKIREMYPDVNTIQDLYEQPGGRDWWFVHGSGLSGATFDLRDGSRSMRVMERYLNEKNRK